MKRSFAFLSIALFSNLMWARTITWNEAIELAQKNNPDLQSVEAAYQAAVSAETGNLSGFLPNISAKMHGGESGSPGGASTFSYSADLSLTQNLFSGFSDYNTYKLKKINTAQALNELNNAKARISQELKQVFAETFYAQENKKLSESILKRREENLLSVKLQYEVGRENKGSFLLSQANVDSAQYDLLRAKNDADVTIDNFRRYLGLTSQDEVTLESNVPKQELDKALPDFNKLSEQNYASVKAKNDETIAEYNRNISRAAFIPSLDFSANYGYADTTFFPKNDSWSMGLTLTIPLFSGLKDYSSYKANQSKLESSRFSSINLIEQSQKDLKRAYFDLVEALQKEVVDASFNKAGIMRSEIARNKYKNGLLSFEDWDLIENDLISREKDFISSEKNRIIKQSLWEKAQGIGVLK